MLTLLPRGEEAGPGFLGLADEDDVGEVSEIVLGHRDPRPSDDREGATPLEFFEDGAHAGALHDHPGDANDVRARAALEIDRLDVLVDQRNGVRFRRERGQQRQAPDGHVGAFAEDRHRML